MVGFGNIARTLAKFISGFGFDIVAYDPFLPDKVFADAGVTRVTLEELCKTSDIISVHVPMSPETKHLIDKPQFDMMKKGTILVNTSRGGLVSQEALCDALDAGIIAAAGVDVLETFDK